MKGTSFDDYDEFASDVIDNALTFLVRKFPARRDEFENMKPKKMWKVAVEAGWEAPQIEY